MKKIDIKKNTIANYIGQLYSILIGIFILPLYLQYLGAEAYGLVGFFTMFTSWMLLLDIGLSSTLSRESAYLKDKVNGLIKLKNLIISIEFIFSITSTIIVVILYIYSDMIVENWLKVKFISIGIYDSVRLFGILFALRWFVGLYQGAIIGFEEQVWLNFYRVIVNSLKFIGSFLLVKYVTNDIFYFFLYQLLIGIMEFIIIRYKVHKILPRTGFLLPSVKPIRKIAPFALSIAYTAGISILFMQTDKLLLSHYLSLSEYGYFTLVAVISSAIIQLSGPISQAIIPRMTSLLSNNKESEMLILYHQSTQFVSIVIFSVVAIVVSFPYELLYAWTGDEKASHWAAPILFWYSIGNGILAIGAFQYYLQYAHGNLKYHIRMSTLFPLFSLPIIMYSVINYGAIGAGVAWFCIQLVGFIIWPHFVHNKFAKGHHKDWLLLDIFPAFLVTVAFILIVNLINFDLTTYSRIGIFLILLVLGVVLLIFNSLSYQNIRNILRSKIGD